MANAIINGTGYHYDPFFYANQAMQALEKRLVMAQLVYRQYDRNVQDVGSTINIRKPSTFTVQNMPSTAQDVAPSQIQISLDKWKGNHFVLSDKELSLSADGLIAEHINPLAYAIAGAIDDDIMAKYIEIPWQVTQAGTPAKSDITNVRTLMGQNLVPVDDGKLNLVLDPTTEGDYLNLFSDQNISGLVGVNTQITGLLGQKYGFNTYMSQNVKTHTSGTASTTTLAANGAFSAGVSTVNLDAGSVTGTLVAGDIIKFAGHSQQYVVTNTTITAATNAYTGVTISPSLQSSVADNEVVTVTLGGAKVQNLAFHETAIALAMAPLSTMGADVAGAKMATVTKNNITLRSRIWYNGDTAQVCVGLDVLYGVKVLDANRAVRFRK